MCGIAGVIGNFTDSECSRIVGRMVSALDHRGPDDRGMQTWTLGSNTVCFGHTRLSIIDLSSAGHQPMTEASGRYATVFNGEIYNFKELRKLLDPDGRVFRTATDTEAILHAYARWSLDGFRRLRGMFAFALLDKESQQVHLVRDPLGIKPLYYYASGRQLLFASEVRALLATGCVPRQLDGDAVAHYLSCGWVGGSRTAIAAVHLLQPGEVLSVDLGNGSLQCRLTSYEALDCCTEKDLAVAPDRVESAGHTFHLLQESVKLHLQSDVPIGLFLSGGIDSTALLHMMREAGCQEPRAFTVVFPERSFSEQKIARQVATRYGAQHNELRLTEADLLRDLPQALNAMDQPTMDGINTFVISKAVRAQGIRVALSGLGSDELFAGYSSFKRSRWARRFARLSLPLRQTLSSCCRRIASRPPLDKTWDLLAGDGAPWSTYRISRQLFRPADVACLLGSRQIPAEPAMLPAYADDINEISRLEMAGYMTGLLLRDTDTMSMASALEVRVPFVDKVVIRHVLRLPGAWKVSRSRPKPFLLDSMRGAVPNYVWDRPKMGFVLPFDRWMRSKFRAELEETFAASRVAQCAGLSPEALVRIWRRYLDGSVRWSRPWSLFVLLRWCERHRVTV